MNAPTILTASAPADPERRFLAACDLILEGLRTPLQRYKKVANLPDTAAFMKMERAKDAMDASRALHKQFVSVAPSLAGHPNALDFKAADRGRELSKRIGKFCNQLSAKMEAEDEAFFADEPDHFTTPRVTSMMGG